MKNTKLIQIGLLTSILTLSVASMGCKHEEAVKENLRTKACETVEKDSQARRDGCAEGASLSYQIAKAAKSNDVKADPIDVLLLAVQSCYDRHAVQEQNPDALLGCNLGASEGLIYSRETLELVRIDMLKSSQANNARSSERDKMNAYLALPYCETTAEVPAELAPACIGMQPITQEQLVNATKQIDSAHARLISDGVGAAGYTARMNYELSDVNAKIAKVNADISYWQNKAAPMENQLAETASARNGQSTSRNRLAAIKGLLLTLPVATNKAYADARDSENDERRYDNELENLKRGLENAKDDRSDARRTKDEAQRKYKIAKDKKDDQDRRDREAEEKKQREEKAKRDAEEAKRQEELRVKREAEEKVRKAEQAKRDAEEAVRRAEEAKRQEAERIKREAEERRIQEERKHNGGRNGGGGKFSDGDDENAKGADKKSNKGGKSGGGRFSDDD